MRQLLVKVEQNRGREVVKAAARYDAVHVLRFEAAAGEEPADAVLLHVENDQVGPLTEALKDIPGFTFSLFPHEVQTFAARHDTAERQTREAKHRSPIEVYVRGVRASGSWASFLGYALLAGALSWAGLFTSTIFLLVAAMLVAPFPSAAMNTAVATARGDYRLLGRSTLRYFAALFVGAAAASILSLVFAQRIVTDLMQTISFVSETSLILPLAAGVAGALHASNSEESSFVSAAGAGMLVAAALSPPVGVVGMASVLGEWDMARRALFLLLLQIAGINLTGAAVFRLYGMSPKAGWYERGSRLAQRTAYFGTVIGFAALLFWQFSTQPELLRPTQAQAAAAIVGEAVRTSDRARLVSADVRFATPEGGGAGVLVGSISVWPTDNSEEDALKRYLEGRIENALLESRFVTPALLDVTVLTELDNSANSR